MIIVFLSFYFLIKPKLSEENLYPESAYQIIIAKQNPGGETFSAKPGEYREWFAAPDGKPSGDGTKNSPWDLAAALAGKKSIKPGDVLWLRGGRYVGTFTSRLEGTGELPVHVRQYPGERAVLDKNLADRQNGTLNVRGGNVWFWDFEVTNSFEKRDRLDPSGAHNPWRGSGINVWAANTKYINLVIRDNGHGFGLWNEDGGTEIYGCLIFNNGNNKKEHGVYGHNKTGTQHIRDNIIFNNAGYGLHLYANSTKSSLSGFEIEGNTIFNNGALTLADQVADEILVGGVQGVPAERVVLRENYIYNRPDAPTSKSRGVRLGYEDTGNKDVKILDNYIVSKVPLRIWWWQNVEARGNTIYSDGKDIEIISPAGVNLSDYLWESNKYISGKNTGPNFLFNEQKINFTDWKQNRNFDLKGRVLSLETPRSEANIVFIRPNKYQTGRATVVIYNWQRQENVPVDFSGILQPGDEFEIIDVQNYFGGPVWEGSFAGKAVNLPMNLGEITKPQGNVERLPVHTTKEFGVFIIQKKGFTGKKPGV